MKVWRHKATIAKTWIGFKIYMIDEYDNFLEYQAIDKHRPYKTSNLAEEEVLTSLQEIHDTITQDRAYFVDLSEANAILFTSNTANKEAIKTLQKKSIPLCKKWIAC